MKIVHAVLAMVLLLAPMAGAAQAQRTDPIAETIRRARRALDDLRYPLADSLARSVLGFSAQIGAEDRAEALMIVAAALYPEDVRAQRRDSAVVFLRQLVRLAPDRTISRALTWSGLDSLLEQTRQSTFAAYARPQAEYAVRGVGQRPAIVVTASRPARFLMRLEAAPGTARPVPLDSLPASRAGSLTVPLFVGDEQRVRAGRWVLAILAVDAASSDTIVQRFPITVTAPPLTLVEVPRHLDSTQVRPEWQPPRRGTNVAIGVGLAGVTYLLAQVIRADAPIRDAVDADGRAMVASGGFALGGILGALIDKGRPLPENAAHNRVLEQQFRDAVRTAEVENERRRAAYTAMVTVGERLP